MHTFGLQLLQHLKLLLLRDGYIQSQRSDVAVLYYNDLVTLRNSAVYIPPQWIFRCVTVQSGGYECGFFHGKSFILLHVGRAGKLNKNTSIKECCQQQVTNVLTDVQSFSSSKAPYATPTPFCSDIYVGVLDRIIAAGAPNEKYALCHYWFRPSHGAGWLGVSDYCHGYMWCKFQPCHSTHATGWPSANIAWNVRIIHQRQSRRCVPHF